MGARLGEAAPLRFAFWKGVSVEERLAAAQAPQQVEHDRQVDDHGAGVGVGADPSVALKLENP